MKSLENKDNKKDISTSFNHIIGVFNNYNNKLIGISFRISYILLCCLNTIEGMQSEILIAPIITQGGYLDGH